MAEVWLSAVQSVRSRRQNQGQATGRVGMRQSFDSRTGLRQNEPGRSMEKPAGYCVVSGNVWLELEHCEDRDAKTGGSGARMCL